MVQGTLQITTIDRRMHYIKCKVTKHLASSDTMAEAARVALKKAGLECKDIDLVITSGNMRIIMAMAKKGLAEEKILP